MAKKSTGIPITELKNKPRLPILLILDSSKSNRPLFINQIYEENIKFIDYLLQENENIFFNRIL